jgi:hypothetical protein
MIQWLQLIKTQYLQLVVYINCNWNHYPVATEGEWKHSVFATRIVHYLQLEPLFCSIEEVV